MMSPLIAYVIRWRDQHGEHASVMASREGANGARREAMRLWGIPRDAILSVRKSRKWN